MPLVLADPVQLNHGFDRFAQLLFADAALLGRAREHATSDRLGQHQSIARLRSRVAHDPGGMNAPRHREPVFDFRIAHTVAADEYRPGFGHALRPAA